MAEKIPSPDAAVLKAAGWPTETERRADAGDDIALDKLHEER